jgi:CHRD domain-containing protein
MHAMNGSGVSGNGHVIKEAGAFTVSITLTGLPAGSAHLSHIHVGACATATNADPVAFALVPTIANSTGEATATTAITAGYSLPMAGWYVNVHVGPDNTQPSYVPSISCGDLPP